ncbi:MAG TPA: sigma-70 family RNA polymerase sigma factor [Terriglobales bacterium]|nr:sigma-70 family RNA polymerase sigma factor [Terriglobales bacterium]
MSDAGLDQGPKIAWKELRESDDNTLILQLGAGNHDALAVIVDRYQQLVLSVALRIVRDQSEAEEVVQTVFLEVFRHPAQFDPRRGTLKMWLLQFAYSRSLNARAYLERRKFYSRVDLAAVECYGRCFEVPGQLSTSETARLIRQGLRGLNERQKRAIKLIFFQGLSLEEAARECGETLAATRHHYYRGLTKLREIIQLTRNVRTQKGEDIQSTMGLEVADAEPRPI